MNVSSISKQTDAVKSNNYFSTLGKLDQQYHTISSFTGALLCIQIPAFINRYKQEIATEKTFLFENLAHKIRGCQSAFNYPLTPIHQFNIWKLAQTCINRYKSHGANIDPEANLFEKGLHSIKHQSIATFAEQWKKLQEAYTALDDASLLTKPLSFIRHYNHSISKKVFGEYRFDLPISTEALFYGICGTVLGSTIYTLAHHSITHYNNKRGDNNE